MKLPRRDSVHLLLSIGSRFSAVPSEHVQPVLVMTRALSLQHSTAVQVPLSIILDLAIRRTFNHSEDLEYRGAGVRNGVVFLARTAADTDRAHDLAVALQRNAAGEDHDLALIRHMDAEELPPDCDCVARSLVAMSKAREV